jgi:uncharacterized protein YjiS (DUF1127 family)
MSTTSLATHTPHAPAAENRSLTGRLRAFCAELYRAVEHRRAVNSLHEFDDHMLSDIGLSRSDITWNVVARRRD